MLRFLTETPFVWCCFVTIPLVFIVAHLPATLSALLSGFCFGWFMEDIRRIINEEE